MSSCATLTISGECKTNMESLGLKRLTASFARSSCCCQVMTSLSGCFGVLVAASRDSHSGGWSTGGCGIELRGQKLLVTLLMTQAAVHVQTGGRRWCSLGYGRNSQAGAEVGGWNV